MKPGMIAFIFFNTLKNYKTVTRKLFFYIDK